MTNKTRFLIAVVALIVAAIMFTLFTFVPVLHGTSKADFFQGFAGGIAGGAFLGILHYSREIRRGRRVA
ncbi:hypothetical protein [Mucilaginibacter sp.]|uniref:hypothetical protein n=1 Tax=Mucilaginibacter sp. TaxID=1882438 RepID=UPI0035BC04DD